MADEARIQGNFSVRNTAKGLNYQRSIEITADSNAGAPTPGRIDATTAGVDVDLAQLTTPGLAYIQNHDATNYVEVGIWDGTTFFPILEVMPTESYPLRLSRNLEDEFGTGTGTTGASINRLRLRGIGGTCECTVEVFEK